MSETARRHGLAELWGLLTWRAFAVPALVVWTVTVFMLLTAEPTSTRPWAAWELLLANAGHAPIFGLQSLLLVHVLAPKEGGRERRAFVIAACTCVVYGAGLEWWQGQVGRTSSLADCFTNAVGAFGVPWALASGRVFGPRTLVVIAASLVTAGWAMVEPVSTV